MEGMMVLVRRGRGERVGSGAGCRGKTGGQAGGGVLWT